MKTYLIVRKYVTGYKESLKKYFNNKYDALQYAQNKNKKLSTFQKALGAKFTVRKLTQSEFNNVNKIK